KGVCGSNRNGFLAEAAVKTADNFVLAEQLDHGVFYRAIEAHVVVQVDVLLLGQLLGAVCAIRSVGCFRHSVLRFRTSQCRTRYFRSTYAGTAASSNCSNNCWAPIAFISSPNTFPKCFASGVFTSSRRTWRSSNFSSDVAFRSAIPQGTIKSK